MIKLKSLYGLSLLCLLLFFGKSKIEEITPQKKEIDQSQIQRLRKSVESNQLRDITSVVVLMNKEVLVEEYYNGAEKTTMHDTRSLTKSFTSTLLGMAIAEGHIQSLDQTLDEFYELKAYENYSKEKAKVTLRSLLTMSSGFDGFDFDPTSPGNEEKMYPTKDWVKFTLDLPMKEFQSNDLEWQYFTAGVILLGDILDKSVPGGLEEYAKNKLFGPLGIDTVKWQYTPSGVPNTAGSCQMTSLDYASYGQLYSNRGQWEGKRLMPESWVDETFTAYHQLPDNLAYGYLFWNKSYRWDGTDYNVFAASGNGGNKVFVFEDLDLVIVITSTAYNQSYAHRQSDTIVQDYILPGLDLN